MQSTGTRPDAIQPGGRPRLPEPLAFELSDCRTSHDRVYDVEVHDGDTWVPDGRLVVLRDLVMHDGDHVHTVEYHGATQALVLKGKAGNPAFRARLNLTEDGNGFIGTMSADDGTPVAVRGTGLEVVYHTQRRLGGEPTASYEPWSDFTIRTGWVDGVLTVTYLLGSDDVSDRVRVTKVDRPKGETTLEMPAEFSFPFSPDSFAIVLASGSHSFTGTFDDGEGSAYDWRGSTEPLPEVKTAAAARGTRAAALSGAAPAATMSLQDLDNVSAIQVVTDTEGQTYTVDHAQTTCGRYFNECLVNALDKKWIDGIYGHAYSLSPGVQHVFDAQKQFFADHAVLGTGQMLYDNFGSSDTYKDLLNKVRDADMKTAWEELGKNEDIAPQYQAASNDLYLQGYRDAVVGMRPYLDDDPGKWAFDYFTWLSDDANLLTWQIQIASGMFDNVKTRMYEWYVKLQVLAPEEEYGKQFLTIAYSALLGVAYSKARWDDDIAPFLLAVIENAIAGVVDQTVVDAVTAQAIKEQKDLLLTLASTAETGAQLANAIAAALSAREQNKTMQQLAGDPNLHAEIGAHLEGTQYKAWDELTRSGKARGLCSSLFYGAGAAFLIYTIVQDDDSEQTPTSVATDASLGLLALGLVVKGIQRVMSIGVGKYLEKVAKNAGGNAFKAFAGDIATWFQEGGKVVPTGRLGTAFVGVFGESSAKFLATRLGPAMAVCGVVLSAFMLADAIKSNNPREIVFEALNTFLALATVVSIGFELMSFAWAGPVGLVVAGIGLIVVLIQLIWNLIDPPKPPADPITEFVNGPMVAKGYATA